MRSLFIIALFLLGGVLSDEIEDRHAPKCKNPKGKLWSSILDSDCGQSVCKRVGWRKASWEKCPRAATEEKLNQLEEIVRRETRKVIEKVEEVCHASPTNKTLSTVTRFSAPFSGSWYVGVGYVDAISFSPSKDIAIRGISLYRANEDIVSYSGVIRLRERSSKDLIIAQSFNFTTDDSETYFDQLFTTPANVMAGMNYTITLTYYGDRTAERRVQRGSGGLSSVSSTCDGEAIPFQFFNSDYFEGEGSNGSSESGGQIPRILFTCSEYKKKSHHSGDDVAGNSNLE